MSTPRASGRLAAAAALVAGTLLAAPACSGAGDGESSSKGSGYNAGVDGVANPSGTKGGTLRFVGIQDADSWDTTRMYYGFAFDFARYYSRQLVGYAPVPGAGSIRLEPDLAKAGAEISDGGRTYSYELKNGLKWEDGKPVTSRDVKYGIERQWAQDVLSGGPVHLRDVLDPDGSFKGPYEDPEGLDAIETPDDKRIVFHLPEPNGDFEQMLAMPTNSPVRKDKDTKSKYALKPFSSGPYRFQSYTPNKSLMLVRNRHWKRSTDTIRKALPDRIKVTLLTDHDERDELLLNGEADLDLNQRGMEAAGRRIALKRHRDNIDNPQTGFVSYVAFPQSVEPFDDVHCRRAVIHGTDHKAVQTARGGPAAGGPIAPNMLPPVLPSHEKNHDPYGMLKAGGRADTERAEEELEKCGEPDGFRTTLAVRSTVEADIRSAEAIRKSLAKIGITVEIDVFDGARGTSIVGSPATVERRGYGMILYGWGPDFPSGQGYGLPLWHSQYILQNGNYNHALIDDERIDDAFAEAIGELDRGRAAAIHRRIGHEVMKGGYYLPLTYQKVVQWRSDRLTNVYASDAYNGWYDFVSLGVR